MSWHSVARTAVGIQRFKFPTIGQFGTVRSNWGSKPTPFGHLGAFCEQAENWAWLNQLGAQLNGCKAINLFAYTGGNDADLGCLGRGGGARRFGQECGQLGS